MSQNGKTGSETGRPNKPENENVVITPAGPVPKDRAHLVRQGEEVRRKADGTLEVVPKNSDRPDRK